MGTTSGSAERLQKAPEGWRLEFQQLVYNSPTLLRPRRFCVTGEQAILQQLRELSGHEPLVRDTERLFRGTLPEGVYVVRDGRWFPESLPDKLPEPPAAEDVAPETTPRGRALLEQIARRMESLEDSVHALQEQLDSALSQLVAAATKAAQSAAQAVTQVGQAPTLAVKPLSAAGAVAEAEAQAAAAATAAKAATPVPAAPQPPARKPIALPAATALTDLIRGLAGPEAQLTSCDRIDWGGVASQQHAFIAVLQDGAGDEAGGMIFDMESALRLAGALLMEPDELIDTHLEENIMSEELLDAASEVCNTLTSALNKVSGNRHLRSGKVQPLTEERAAQLSSAHKRDDYRYNRGGRLSLIAC